MNQREEVKEVPGRRNFGAQHPVMTPQPCIMIATYDENQVPDVMMAAWGGQCDYDNTVSFAPQTIFSTSSSEALKKRCSLLSERICCISSQF